MNRILISLAIIGAVSAIVIGGTISYFSDTETSSGNTFTAGSIDLKVDNECSFNGKKCVCNGDDCRWEGTNEPCTCTWEEKDLTDGDLFFQFSDIKPGDWGEDTISLHVHENDAWACAAIRITKNDDNTCVDPEIEAEGEGNCNNGQPSENFDGELAQNLQFFFWADVCEDEDGAVPGDNIYQPECDKELMEGPVSAIIDNSGNPVTVVYTLADSEENNVGGSPGDPLEGSHTYYIGKAWCFGTINIDDKGNISCDGSLVGNEAQTDKVEGDIIFYAIQERNNDNFKCEQWNPNSQR